MELRHSSQTTVTVRFSDTDAMGHCNNSRYFSFMEEARIQYIKTLFPGTTADAAFKKFPFILGDIQCSFKTPAFAGDKITISAGTTSIGTKSFVLEYDLANSESGKLVATGKSVIVMFDYKTQQTYVIPDEMRSLLSKN